MHVMHVIHVMHVAHVMHAKQTVHSMHVGASLLSFSPRLLMNDHHWKDGKWLKDKEPIDSVTKTEAKDPSVFPDVILFVTLRVCIVCRPKK